jgi:hypothetical protein
MNLNPLPARRSLLTVERTRNSNSQSRMALQRAHSPRGRNKDWPFTAGALGTDFGGTSFRILAVSNPCSCCISYLASREDQTGGSISRGKYHIEAQIFLDLLQDRSATGRLAKSEWTGIRVCCSRPEAVNHALQVATGLQALLCSHLQHQTGCSPATLQPQTFRPSDLSAANLIFVLHSSLSLLFETRAAFASSRNMKGQQAPNR